MGNVRAQTSTMRMVVRKHKSCELCGSTRDLQAHHIIPITVGGPDVEENILCVCKKCHALLTPHSILTKMGLEKNVWEIRFWQHFHDLAEAGETVDSITVMDYLDDELFPMFRSLTFGR